MVSTVPVWVTFPGENWAEIAPEDAGLNEPGFRRYLEGMDVGGAAFGGEDHTGDQWGAVLTRGGYLLHSWGDKDYKHQTASTGKAFMWVLLGLAVAEGLLDPDEPVNRYWTGEGQLSHPHKYLDRGHHKTLTWRHLIGNKSELLHYGGFPIELGNEWTAGPDPKMVPDSTIPEWAHWTGDPFNDSYAHVEPGTEGLYSSAGFWRLGQALTAVWSQDLKRVLDDRLFGKIGIRPERWDWFTGRQVKDQKYFYPTIPDSYTYLDPPFEIAGHPVRSGPGWVVISASDLARFGHLLAVEGAWRGEQLIDPQWLRGHSGGNKCGVSGESRHFTALAVVTTVGLDHAHATEQKSFLPEDIFFGPVRRVAKC